MKDNFFCYILVSFLFLAGGTFAQDALQDSLFSKAVNLYKSKKFDAAYRQFDTLVKNTDWRKNKIESHLFLAKIALAKYQYPKAEAILKDVKKSYSENPHLTETLFTLSEALWLQKKKFESFTVLMQISQIAANDSIRKKTVDALSAFMNRLSADELKQTIDTYRDKPGQEVILLAVGKMENRKNEQAAGREKIFSVVTKYPASPYHELAVQLYEEIDDADNTANKGMIAVVLPLSTTTQSQTPSAPQEVLDGIKLAVDEYNSVNAAAIGLRVFDSKRDTNQIKKIILELAACSNLRAVIGPLFSDECRFFINNARQLRVPVLSPTANDEELSTLSQSFFQLNPPFSVRGELLARYVFLTDQKRKIAVVYNDDPISSFTASGFIKEFVKLGGSVVEMKYKNEKSDMLTVLSPLTGQASDRDGIFLPIPGKTYVTPIFSALTRMQTSLSLYGNQEWISAPGLETSSDLSSLLTIASDYYIDYSDTNFAALNKKFFEASGYEINKNVCFGYGSAAVVVSGINGLKKGMPLSDKIANEELRGLQNKYSFNTRRINTNINIIKMVNGKYYLLDIKGE